MMAEHVLSVFVRCAIIREINIISCVETSDWCLHLHQVHEDTQRHRLIEQFSSVDVERHLVCLILVIRGYGCSTRLRDASCFHVSSSSLTFHFLFFENLYRLLEGYTSFEWHCIKIIADGTLDAPKTFEYRKLGCETLKFGTPRT